MEKSAKQYNNNGEFHEMLNKKTYSQISSDFSESSGASNYGFAALTSCPSFLQATEGEFQDRSLNKTSSFTTQMEEDETNIVSQDLDLNDSISEKTMDPAQLSLMLAALDDEDDDNKL